MSSSSKVPVVELVHQKDVQNKTYTWHAHDFREVLTMKNVTEKGLSRKEVLRRRKESGSNVFTEEARTSVFVHIFDQLKSPLAFVLVLAFFVTLALGEFIDAGVIAFALFIAVTVGVLQEGRASRAFEKLSTSQVLVATVIREGKKQEIPASEVVPGDIVILQSGAQVPADIRLIRAKQLSINEATLTGEWRSVDKSLKAVQVGTPLAEQTCMAWKGTYVAEGYGSGVVIATGDQTAVGKLASTIQNVIEEETPLQYEMKQISKVMLYIITGLVLLIFAVGLIQGQTLHDMLLMAIAIAVASVPEGLPAAVTIILAVGMEALLKRGGLVRNLLAAETLGSTTYILTDKTGTLTKAQMAVTDLLRGDGSVVKKGSQEERDIFDVSLSATDAYTDTHTHKVVIRGDSVERAILESASHAKVFEDRNSLRACRIDYVPFTSENRYAVSLSECKESFKLCVNGAPHVLIKHATHIHTPEGPAVFSDTERNALQTAIHTATRKGKRLIAVGYKDVAYDDIPEHDPALLSSLVLCGIVVLDDPLRDGVAEAIAGVQDAGAEVVLITGDSAETALSIAQAVGIAGENDIAMTGTDLEELSDEEILVALEDVRVFARVLPNQKLRIVQILQQKGEIVAMTGDGINDAPALRKANIGVAIGSGTEVAKEASDLVLVKDSFATMYSAIEEGRRITSNLRKIVGYLLSTSLTEVMLIGTALLVGAAVPILPAQILWANVIEEGLMSVAFAFEKGEKGAMKRRPHDIHEEGILSRDMLWFIALVVTVLSMLLVGFYFYLELYRDLHIDTLRSIMFLAISMDSLFIAFAFRSLSVPVWRVPLRDNVFFIGSFLVSALLLFVVLSVPFFQTMLSYTPLPMSDIMLVVGFSVAALVIVEFAKWLFFERKED